MNLSLSTVLVLLAYLAAISFFGFYFRPEEEIRRRLLSRQPQPSLVGHRRLRRRDGDLYPHVHECSRLLLQRELGLSAVSLAALSYASGPTVGAFLLGVSSPRVTSTGTLIGMLAGLTAPTLVGLLTPLAWTWNVAVGAITTYSVGYLCSRILTKRSL